VEKRENLEKREREEEIGIMKCLNKFVTQLREGQN